MFNTIITGPCNFLSHYTTQHGTFAQIHITRNLCNVSYSISVEAINACGTSAKTYKSVYVPPCGDSYVVSPNPASNEVAVSVDESKLQDTNNKTFDEVKIYDLQGNVKKYQKFNNVSTTKINVAGLTNGTYFIEITNDTYKEKHQLVIQK